MDINQKDKTNGPSIPSFLLKTYEIVCDPLSDEIISWNDEGNGFIVK
jgi:heat shock transcription factor 1